MAEQTRILIVEDSEDDFTLVLRQLARGGLSPHAQRVETATALKAALKTQDWDLVISDYNLPEFSGEEVLAILKGSDHDLPVLIVSGFIGEERAVDIMKAGAHDVVMKEHLERLVPSVRRSLRETGLRAKQQKAEEDSRKSEARLRGIMENVAEGIITIDEKGLIESFNPAAESMFGYAAHEITGHNVSVLMPEPQASQHNANIRRYLDTGASEIFDKKGRLLIGRRKDGVEFPLEITVSEMRLDDRILFIGAFSDLSEKIKAEADLRFSRESLANAQRIAELGSWEWNIATDKLIWSEEVFRIFGVREIAFAGTHKAFLNLVHPEDRSLVKQAVDDALYRYQPYSIDHRLVRPSGEMLFVHEEGEVAFNSSGAPIRLNGTCQNITERKRIEETLERSERRFRDYAESSSDWFWEMDASLRYTHLSERFFEVYHISRDRVIGQSLEDLAQEKDEESWWKHLEHLRQRLPFRDYAYQTHLPDGNEVHFMESGKPIFTSQGEFSGYRGTGRDITEEVQAKEKAQRTQARFQEAVQAINEGFALHDSDDRLIMCNSRYREIYHETADMMMPGVTFEELIRAGVERGQFPESRDHEEEWLEERLLQHREPLSSFTQKGSDERWIRVSEYRTNEGGYVGIRNDITERTKIDNRLKESQKLESLGQLAGGVAHDFNNILMIIGGYTKRALDDPDDVQGLNESLGEVLRATEKAAGLTKQLLAFGRRNILESRIVRAAGVLTELNPLLHPLLGEMFKLEFLIGDEDTDACVNVDTSQLTQALINLAINARDAMPRGGRLLLSLKVVEVDEEFAQKHMGASPGCFVRLTMEDEGCGMDDETRERVFEPFFTTKEQGKGTGLGLAMVYGFAQQSGGFLNVESTLGEGSTFSIYLPLAEGEAETEIKIDATVSRGKGEIILLAEDDEAVRNLTQKNLSDLGYEVITAVDGFDALEVESDHEGGIDLLLSDVVMPNLGGIELCKAIRQTRPNIKIVLMSGYPSRGTGKKIDVPDDFTILQKPVSVEKLAATVRTELDRD